MGQLGFSARPAATAAVCAMLMASVAPNVFAQSNTIFPKGWDANVRDRLFMRMGYVSIMAKTKSEDAYDVSGPVVTAQDLVNAATYADALRGTGDPLDPDLFSEDPLASYTLGTSAIRAEVQRLGGLGTPPGVKAKVKNASTIAFSIGYWLTDDHDWMVEGFVLASPMTIRVEGAGVNSRGVPNGVAGKEILTTKMLPPLVVLSRHFGDKNWPVRPYLGLAATYAVFYGAKTTPFYDSYVGGTSKASIKNAGGFGGFLGLTSPITEDWHVNVAVGKLKLKTEATLTTYNTVIKSGQAVIQDYSQTLINGIRVGEQNIDTQLTTKLMQAVARSKGQQDLGSFTRKQKNSLDNTIVNVSVGRSF